MSKFKHKLNHDDDPYTQTRHSGGIAIADDPTPDPPPSDPPADPPPPTIPPGGDPGE